MECARLETAALAHVADRVSDGGLSAGAAFFVGGCRIVARYSKAGIRMDPGTVITTTLTSVRAITDIARGLKCLKNLSEVQAAAVELNEQIINIQQQLFDANTAMSAQVEHIRELEAQIARMNDWQAQKQRYHLVAPFPACMVYALQESMSGGEPAHYLCAACFQKGHRSILQGRETHGPGRATAVYYCPDCKSEAKTQWSNVTPPQYYEDIPPSG
jgi:hypothetical protein